MIIELPLAEESPRLEISLRNTALRVEPNADGTASARFVPKHEEEAWQEPDRFVVGTRVADDGGPLVVTIDEQRVEDPQKGTLRVQVPAAVQLRIRNRNGAVKVHDLAGQLNARTSNGAINVRQHRGPVRAAAANGAINISGVVATRLEASSANGSISLSEVETPDLQVSTSNGRIRVAQGRIGRGTVRCANGVVRLQLAQLTTPQADLGEHAADSDPGAPASLEGDPASPEAEAEGGNGRPWLAIYSGNGRVSVALPEQISAIVKARTRAVMRNSLGSALTRSEQGVTTLRFGVETPPLLVLINNLRGGIEVMKYDDFDTEHRDREEFVDDDARHHGVWFDVDFSEEFPRFMRDMQNFGMKFGRLGEEVSREMRRAFKFGGPGRPGRPARHQDGRHQDGRHQRQDQQADTSEEVKTVLDLLQQGKISVEEAEKLIAALRR